MGKDENLPEQPLDEENEIGVVEVGHAPWGEGRKNDRGENEGSCECLTLRVEQGCQVKKVACQVGSAMSKKTVVRRRMMRKLAGEAR